MDLSCQDDNPDAGARELLGGKPGPRLPKSMVGRGTSPLHLASCRGHVGVVHELLLAGADATRGDQFGFSALHLAVRHGFPEVVTELLTCSSVSVDLLDENGETAMHTAARYAKTICLSRLLEFGGDPTIASNSGRRAIDVIGLSQDKHNRLSLPHTASQLVGGVVGKVSVKNNNNMPPPQLPRDSSAEERMRRLLTLATRGIKDGWSWPRDTSPMVESDIVIARHSVVADDAPTGDDCSLHSVAETDQLGGEQEGNTKGSCCTEGNLTKAAASFIDVGGEVTADLGVAETYRATCTMTSVCNNGEDESHVGSERLERPPLRRLHVRGLVKGRLGDERVIRALDRWVLACERACVM